ncbi:MAG TPA: retroviral-like aspartic protease family protein [Gemmataceae bacterium]|nr:retroviral-like aspartic protease family protein [Gemmataceae bacterium]
MSRFSIDFVVANNRDLVKAEDGLFDPAKVRKFTIKGVVDSGATRLVLPQSIAKQLGLPTTGKVKVRYADGHTAHRNQVDNVHVEILGRSTTCWAIVEPRRRNALIGAILLEDLDLLIDCRHERLVPRDPKYVVSEIE